MRQIHSIYRKKRNAFFCLIVETRGNGLRESTTQTLVGCLLPSDPILDAWTSTSSSGAPVLFCSCVIIAVMIPRVRLVVPMSKRTAGFSLSTRGALTRWTKIEAHRPLAAQSPIAVLRIIVGKTSAVTTDSADQLSTRHEWKMHTESNTAHAVLVKRTRNAETARDSVVATSAPVNRNVRPILSMMNPAKTTPGILASEKKKARE